MPESNVVVHKQNQKESMSFAPFREGLQIIKTLIGQKRVSELNFDNLDINNNLKVYVEISYSRQTDESGQKLLNEITSSLRHVSDDDVRIELKGGGVVLGLDLKVKGAVQVVTYGGIIDPSDLFDRMHNWLMEILEKGLVDVD